MRNPLRVCVLQMRVDDSDCAGNVRRVAALAGELGEAPVDLVVLPELADLGYDLATIRDRMSGLAESPLLGAMRSLAGARNCFVAGGIVERDGGSLFDALTVIEPGGSVIASYRKIQLWAPGGEADVFEAGSELATVEVRGWTLGLAICNDLRFPEVARGLARREADVILFASAWPFPRVRHFATLLEARAIENQAFVVACNRVGRLGDTVFCGHSRVIDPNGNILASTGEEREALVRAILSPDLLEWARQRPGWRSARRLAEP